MLLFFPVCHFTSQILGSSKVFKKSSWSLEINNAISKTKEKLELESKPVSFVFLWKDTVQDDAKFMLKAVYKQDIFVICNLNTGYIFFRSRNWIYTKIYALKIILLW